jgi:hypothetical protein
MISREVIARAIAAFLVRRREPLYGDFGELHFLSDGEGPHLICGAQDPAGNVSTFSITIVVGRLP